MMRQSCPVCEGADQADFVPLQRHGAYTLHECPACRVQVWLPLEHPGGGWYDKSDYYDLRRRGLASTSELLDWNHKFILKHLAVTSGRLLDVGCATGAFVRRAQQVGFDAYGIDVSEAMIETARRAYGTRNVQVGQLSEYQAASGEKPFDVITIFDVLEHVENPRKFLLDARDLLAPGGQIAVSVPNRDRRPKLFQEGDFPPHHLTRWNDVAIVRFLGSLGFQVRTQRLWPLYRTSEEIVNILIDSNRITKRLKAAIRRSALDHRDVISEGSHRVSALRALTRGKRAGKVVIGFILTPLLFPFIRGYEIVLLAQRSHRPGTFGH